MTPADRKELAVTVTIARAPRTPYNAAYGKERACMIEDTTTAGPLSPRENESSKGDGLDEAIDPQSGAGAESEAHGVSGLTSGRARITSKGQVTIPADVRRRLGLVAGDRVTFTVLVDGTTVMRAKKRSIKDLAGSVEPTNGYRASIEELGFD